MCTSCQADIVWCVTDAGKRIPVDALPAPGGNLRLIDEGQVTRAVVAGAGIDLFDPTDTGVRHVSHFATCPNAAEHRRRS